MQPFRGEGDVEGPKETRSLGALLWVNTGLVFACISSAANGGSKVVYKKQECVIDWNRNQQH